MPHTMYWHMAIPSEGTVTDNKVKFAVIFVCLFVCLFVFKKKNLAVD